MAAQSEDQHQAAAGCREIQRSRNRQEEQVLAEMLQGVPDPFSGMRERMRKGSCLAEFLGSAAYLLASKPPVVQCLAER